MDVAREAGVSAGTVSNYLKNPKRVKPVNRKKIKEAIDKLCFIPDINAQILATGKSMNIILYVISERVISPSTWLHQLPIIQVLHDEFQKKKYALQINIAYADKLKEFEKTLRYNVECQASDGILILSVWEISENIMKYLKERRVPYVLMDCFDSAGVSNEICFDNRAIIRESLEAMYQKGHRRFRYIGVRSKQQDMRERYCGFLDGMEQHGLSVEDSHILYGDFSINSGYECTKQALTEDPSFTAVIAGNDNMAFGAIMAIQEAGYSVPEDYSVCGVDNDVVGRIHKPRLCTVEVDLKGMAEQAVKCLMAQLKDKPLDKKQYVMAHHRIEGGTICKARRS